MQKDKFLKILQFNMAHSKEIQADCSFFYDSIDYPQGRIIRDIRSQAEIIFQSKGYTLLVMPIKSVEIGALLLELNGGKYLILNTNKSRANNNFAVAHELYHVLLQPDNRGEIYLSDYEDNYEDNENELRANAFAGNILMPSDDFVMTAKKIQDNSKQIEIGDKPRFFDEFFTVLKLMSYYSTTYMSVVIRCFEKGIFDKENNELIELILASNSEERQRGLFSEVAKMNGKISIMEPTMEDNFEILYSQAQEVGKHDVELEITSDEDIRYRLKGMREAYAFVKGDSDANN